MTTIQRAPATTRHDVGTPAMLAHGLTKRYGDLTAVDAVDLRVDTGQVYGFLGPNGAGKTTVLKVLVGLVTATSGQVQVLGRKPGDPSALRRIGSLIEAPGCYPYLSGRANLRLLARYAGVSSAAVEEALDAVRLTVRSGDRFGTYSLGMKQRLGVAAALMKAPELVILDEPTNGLDPHGMRDMRALIRSLGERGHTVILSSHLLSEVQEICDRVAVIHRGQIIVEGTVAELRGRADLELTVESIEPAEHVLRGLDAVGEVQRLDGQTLLVTVADTQTASVNRALVSAGIDVWGLRRVERQLEDVFLDLTDPTSQPARRMAGATHV